MGKAKTTPRRHGRARLVSGRALRSPDVLRAMCPPLPSMDRGDNQGFVVEWQLPGVSR